MPTVQKMLHCAACERPTLHVSQAPSHVLHLLLTLVTCGLWIFVWAMQTSSTPQCTACGRKRAAGDVFARAKSDPDAGFGGRTKRNDPMGLWKKR